MTDYKALYEKQKDHIHELNQQAIRMRWGDDEIKKLKEENEQLKVKLSNATMDTGKLTETIWEKDEENKKLQEKVKAEHATGKEMYESFMAERSKVSKLQEEIKELKDATVVVARETFQQKVRETTEKFRGMVNAMGEENKALSAENEQLKDFTNWENHPALKHKVVLDDDHYLEHLGEDGELIHPEEVKELEQLKGAYKFQKQVSFWRMCESYNGFHKDTNLNDPEWLGEMDAMIEDRWDSNAWCDGTVEELQKGYRDWVGGEESEDEDA